MMANPITNREIKGLARAIGINTKLDDLGLNLGFEFEDIEIYKADNYSGANVTYEGTKRMLKDFRDNTPQEQQRPLLKQALEDAGLVRQAEIHLEGSTSQSASSIGQAAESELERRSGQQPRTQSQQSVNNTITASDSSTVSGNTQIGQQTNMTNVYNSTQSAPVVHHHITTNVKQAAPQPSRPIFIQQTVPKVTTKKRSANTSQHGQTPPAKRPKIAQSRPSTSTGVTSKPTKKAKSAGKRSNATKKPAAPKAQKKAKNPKNKTPKAPKAAGAPKSQNERANTTKKRPPKANMKAKTSKAKSSGGNRSKKKSKK